MPSDDAITLLERLIATPSFSREEGATADLIADWLTARGHTVHRQGNNVWATKRANTSLTPSAQVPSGTPTETDTPSKANALPWLGAKATPAGSPTPAGPNPPQANSAAGQHFHLLLNSHHDTVRPASTWTTDPFTPTWNGERLTGLGSNDAGGPLVAMLAAFDRLKDTDLTFDLSIAATAEEEISGPNGIASILDQLGPVDCAIVGEPTSLDAAVAEKGLIVLDGVATGVSGHAARSEGTNALYLALDDIKALRGLVLAKASSTLGPVLVTVTQIAAGTQHNVVPDRCTFVVDVRSTDAYTNAQIVELLQQSVVHSVLTPRSLRLQPSGLSPKHPLYRAAVYELGLRPYGSPTLSDQALLPFPTLKLGPGESSRSHSADEFILRSEVLAGIDTYVRLLRRLSEGW